jgi:hypothetical protein
MIALSVLLSGYASLGEVRVLCFIQGACVLLSILYLLQ